MDQKELDTYMATARWQWQMGVLVYHDQRFGHRIICLTQSPGRDGVAASIGSWKGVGMPEAVLNSARASIDTRFTEHLITRYGVAGELWQASGDGLGPF